MDSDMWMDMLDACWCCWHPRYTIMHYICMSNDGLRVIKQYSLSLIIWILYEEGARITDLSIEGCIAIFSHRHIDISRVPAEIITIPINGKCAMYWQAKNNGASLSSTLCLLSIATVESVDCLSFSMFLSF